MLQIKVGGLAYNPSSGQTDMTLKPNKTQRRKHQINSLAFEVRQERNIVTLARGGPAAALDVVRVP